MSAFAAGDQQPFTLDNFTPDQFERPYQLANDAMSVTLRPVGARAAHAQQSGGQVAYRDAFRGVDVHREVGEAREVLIARDRAALESIAYQIIDMRGVIAAVPSDRGIRFVTGNAPRDTYLSAPTLIDAAGRPTKRVWWAVTPSGAGHGTIHLRTDDAHLRYPVTISFAATSVGGVKTNATKRPSLVSTFQNGSISGTLTDSVTGAPVVDEFVSVFDSTGEFATYGFTDASGFYTTVDGLGTGNYYVLVTPYAYNAELYNNISCVGGCSVTSGTAVSVIDGARTANINFSLTPIYGRVTGEVTGGTAATPLGDVTVLFYDNTGAPVASATSETVGGSYEAALLASGSPYKARTFVPPSHSAYVNQLYNGIDCVSCSISSGTPITVSGSQTTPDIDFNLRDNGGNITGRVTNTASTPAGIENAFIEFYNSSGAFLASSETDANGNYTAPFGLVAGTYYVRASAHGYSSELYDNIACESCSVTSGTAVTVTSGATTSNVNFALENALISVSGRVNGTSGGLSGVGVVFYDNTGAQVETAITDGNGDYSLMLPTAGTYYAKTQNTMHSGYVDQLYNGIDCTGCNVTTGTAITVTAGSTLTNINFTLSQSGGRISGKVTSAETSTGIEFATVSVYNSTGDFVSYAIADSSGNYTSFDALTPGTYYATAWASGFATQLYNGINCGEGCDPATGTAINVTAGNTTTGINFQLGSAFARISGTVSDASSNPISGATVEVFDASGSSITTVTTNASGAYLVSLAASGTYYAIASAAGFNSQLYDHIACNGCDPTTGTAIATTIGATTSGVNFNLQASGCSGTVEPPTLPDGAVGTPYSATVSASGMTAPVTFAVSSGELPDGLTLNGSTGQISGTPSAAGTFNFTITATDSANCTAGRNYTVEITQVDTPTTTVLTASPNPSTYGQSVTLTATVTPEGATGTVTFTNGSTTLGSDDLDANGVASIVVSNFNAGTHTITAAYGGAPTFQPSSDTEAVVVNKATPVITWSDPADIVYGTPLGSTQLNATANVPGTFVYTPPAGTVLNAGTHTLSVAFTPSDTTNYNNASKSVQITVLKATPVVTWATPADIVYGTPLSSTQLNATADVPGTFVYTPPAGTVLNAGTHTLSVAFTPNDTTNYNNASKSVQITVLKATPVVTWATPADIVYGTPLGSTQLNATADVPGTFVYTPPAGTVLDAGTHTLSVAFTPNDTANYNNASKSVQINVLKATPVFSNLSSPTIVLGTASTTISGTISAGSLVPPGTVSITLNGVTQSAAIQANGSFSSTFATGGLVPPSYPISFSYAGSPNFNSATGSSTLTVRYATTATVVSTSISNSGSTVVFRIVVFDANNVNISSNSLEVFAYGYRPVGSSTWLPPTTTGNNSTEFDYQNAQGGSYKFNLKTPGTLAPGAYVIGYTIGADTTIHEIPFNIQ